MKRIKNHGPECSCSACISQERYKALNSTESVKPWKLIKSKYPGRCKVCSDSIEAGEYTYWSSKTKELRCKQHVPEDVVVDRLQALNELKAKSVALTSKPQPVVHTEAYKKYGKRVPSRGTRLVTQDGAYRR